VPDVSFAEFLAESFDTLRTERPDAYAALCGCLAPHTVRLEIDGESVTLRFLPRRIEFMQELRAVDIDVCTTARAILAVINAELTLTEAVLADALQLRGTPDDLLVFHDGLAVYVHGAVRTPSFPALLRRFRQQAIPRQQLGI
jgi:hypothetical protein